MILHHRAWTPGRRSRTIVIVGAGFSGTALALRLLREPPAGTCRVVLIERKDRFGPGLAYSGVYPGARLNVPAGNMSLDERKPGDFLDYLRSRDCAAGPHDFVPRELYGDYLEARLHEAALAASVRVRLERLHGTAKSIDRGVNGAAWTVTLEDGSSVLADDVVLAFGHFAPRSPEALGPLVEAGLYTPDPWKPHATAGTPERLLLVGTGLTMADLACHWMRQPEPPREIIAISRRGQLPHTRSDEGARALQQTDLDAIAQATSVRECLATTRTLATSIAREGGDWREVVAALREHAPALWRRLGPRERARFLRHVQPYWDMHRHQLPSDTGKPLEDWIEAGRVTILAGRIVSASAQDGRAVVDVVARGSSEIVPWTVDHVVNCTGPDYHPRRVQSSLVRSLLRAEFLTPDANETGLQVDAAGRLVGRGQTSVDGLYYLGPWLRARDFEATAVPELRRLATSLAQVLRGQAHAAATGFARRGAERPQPGFALRRSRSSTQVSSNSRQSNTSSVE